MRQRRALQSTPTIGRPIPNACDAGQYDQPAAALEVRQSEQYRSDQDRQPPTERPTAEQAIKVGLKVSTKQRFFGKCDQQQIVDRPYPSGRRPLWLPH